MAWRGIEVRRACYSWPLHLGMRSGAGFVLQPRQMGWILGTVAPVAGDCNSE